jgi:mannose-6-phosphate isomerase-like protein (cupin superfamily)
VGYRVIQPDEVPWEERPNQEGLIRYVADITTAGELEQSRARIWRYPPHSRGRRHREGAQEEVFVVLQGTLTMLLGNDDQPERHELAPQSVVAVAPGTGLQMRNETDDEVVVFAYGAPPVTGKAEYLLYPGRTTRSGGRAR